MVINTAYWRGNPGTGSNTWTSSTTTTTYRDDMLDAHRWRSDYNGWVNVEPKEISIFFILIITTELTKEQSYSFTARDGDLIRITIKPLGSTIRGLYWKSTRPNILAIPEKLREQCPTWFAELKYATVTSNCKYYIY